MKTSKCYLSIVCSVTLAATILAVPGRLHGQTAAVKPSVGNGISGTHWNIQVDQVDPGNLNLAYSFRIAIYENLVEELKKTKQFQQVFRDGDVKVSEAPNLLVLKTTVEKYTAGSETRRAVTTVSGATKLTVRSELLTRDGTVVLQRSVNGNVRFFGSNLRATHTLARNITKTIKQSHFSDSGRATATLTGSTSPARNVHRLFVGMQFTASAQRSEGC